MTHTTPEHKILNAVFASQYAISAMDAVAGTPCYRQEVKQAGNRFLKAMEGFTAEVMPLVYGVEDKTMFQLMDFQEQVIARLVTMRPEDAGVYLAILDRYAAQPEETMELMNIEIGEQSSTSNNNVSQ